LGVGYLAPRFHNSLPRYTLKSALAVAACTAARASAAWELSPRPPEKAEQHAITILPIQVELLILEETLQEAHQKTGLLIFDPSLNGDLHEK